MENLDTFKYVCRTLKELSIEAIAWWTGYHKGFPGPNTRTPVFSKKTL